MSGPKVVRIVTREELEAICRGHLQLVDDAVEELKRCAKRHEVLDEALTTGLEQRRVALRQMFARERWSELQKQAQQDVSFLKSELDRIRAQAVAVAEAARSKRRRTEEAARTLISAFEASGREPPRNLLDVAYTARSVDESALAGMQAVLNEALRQLTPPRLRRTCRRHSGSSPGGSAPGRVDGVSPSGWRHSPRAATSAMPASKPCSRRSRPWTKPRQHDHSSLGPRRSRRSRRPAGARS